MRGFKSKGMMILLDALKGLGKIPGREAREVEALIKGALREFPREFNGFREKIDRLMAEKEKNR